MSGYPLGPKIVKPARPREWYLDLVIVAPTGVLVERTGEVLPRDRLAEIAAREPKSLFVTQSADRMLYELHQVYQSDPTWDYQVKPTHTKGTGGKAKRVTATVVRHFGWKNQGKGRERRYHLCLDPSPFCAATIDELIDQPGDELLRLFIWAKLLRDWIIAQNLPPSLSAGALGAALLRSPLWFTDSRKVPRATNARLRPFLPGNHYRLYTDELTRHQAVKLDMTAAHHQVAAHLPLPHANTFVLRGNKPQLDTDGTEGTPPDWCGVTSRKYRTVIDSHHGFIFARVIVPHVPRGAVVHPVMECSGRQDVGLWTTALPHLLDAGLVIEAIYWTASTPETDPALNQYARFALRAISEVDPLLRPTVKRVLLAAYGIKASTPSRMERGVRLSDHGESGAYPAGSGVLPVKRIRLSTEVEPLLAHVAHRAMIEEGLRVRVIEQAQNLQRTGHRVLAIYADALMVEANGRTLPLLPDPWKSAEPLTDLRFLTDTGTAYTSREETRMPGVPRERRQFVERLRHMNR